MVPQSSQGGRIGSGRFQKVKGIFPSLARIKPDFNYERRPGSDGARQNV